jgi:probable rRNA maturation factor
VMEVKVVVNFVGSKRIQELNEELRKQDYTPAVLAFPYYEPLDEGLLLGEVLICKNEAKKLARKNKMTLDEQISALIIHGIKQILGVNHAKFDVTLDRGTSH